MQAQKIVSTLPPTTAAHLDTSGQPNISVSGGGSAYIAPAGNTYYKAVIAEVAAVGSMSEWLLGNGIAKLNTSTAFGDWVASTTTPGASKLSVAHDGTGYKLYNGYASTLGFRVLLLKP